jgi:ribosomal protein S18 acetylase RimI-like enzyme
VPGVEIRPAWPDDAPRVTQFVLALSPETRTLRFFTGITRPSSSLLRAMTVRDDRRDVLLAVHEETVLGHAMSHLDGGSVEIAVVVDDEWQGRGIGGRLVRTLLARAAARGATSVGMDVMGDNRRVLGMVRRMWPDATMKVEGGSVEIKAAVTFAE